MAAPKKVTPEVTPEAPAEPTTVAAEAPVEPVADAAEAPTEPVADAAVAPTVTSVPSIKDEFAGLPPLTVAEMKAGREALARYAASRTGA